MRALVLLVLLAACSPSRRAFRPEPLPPHVARPAAYAVVRLDAPLALEPREGAPVAWPLPPSARPRFGVVRVLGEERGWVLLETLGEPRGAHCAESPPAVEPFRLRFFAPARALVTVTQREVAQSFADGTRIELARGVPVERLTAELFRAHLGATTAVLRLGPTEVGTRYLPSAEPPPATPLRMVAGEAMAAGTAVLGQTGRVQSSELDGAPVYAEEARAGEALVELRPTCARVIVRVPPHVVVAREPPPPPAASSAPSGPSARAGAVVRWRGGREAGVTVREVALEREVEGDGPRRRCFLRSAAEAASPPAGLELCFDRRDLVEPGMGAARRLDEPG